MDAVDRFDEAIASIESRDSFAFDLETTGLDPFSSDLLILSLATEDGVWAIPFAGPVPHAPWNSPEMLKRLRRVFSLTDKLGIGWNLSFDIKHLLVRGIDVRCSYADGMVGVWLLDEMLAKSREIGLKKQADIKLGVSMATFDSTKLPDGVVEDFELQYASDDAKYTYILWHEHVKPGLVEDGLFKVFERICMPMVRAVVEMETNGVLIDCPFLKAMETTLSAQNDKVLADLRTAAGNDSFNPGSSKQLSVLLFDALKLPIKKGHEYKKKSKQWATDKRTLTRYENDSPIVKMVLDYRTSKKLLSTYVGPLQKKAHATHDGRVRCHFRQTGTVTGRLSSREPNLQNIPTKHDVRRCFVPPSGKKLLVADYNQLELRMGGLIAHRTLGRSVIVEQYQQGLDLHEATRRQCDSIGLEKFSVAKVGAAEARRNAKIVNFGYCYGRSAAAFAEDNPGVSIDEAQQLRQLFLYDMYPEIPVMHDVCVKELVERGYVTTITGRRRRFLTCFGRDPESVWWDGWVAWNARVQGSSQDLIQIAMRDIMSDLLVGREKGFVVEFEPGVQTFFEPELCEQIRLLLQVHDELVFEAPESEVGRVKDWIAFRMGRAVHGEVIEFPAEVGVGDDWKGAKA